MKYVIATRTLYIENYMKGFLIDEQDVVATAYYGKDFGDHVSFDELKIGYSASIKKK